MQNKMTEDEFTTIMLSAVKLLHEKEYENLSNFQKLTTNDDSLYTKYNINVDVDVKNLAYEIYVKDEKGFIQDVLASYFNPMIYVSGMLKDLTFSQFKTSNARKTLAKTYILYYNNIINDIKIYNQSYNSDMDYIETFEEYADLLQGIILFSKTNANMEMISKYIDNDSFQQIVTDIIRKQYHINKKIIDDNHMKINFEKEQNSLIESLDLEIN